MTMICDFEDVYKNQINGDFDCFYEMVKKYGIHDFHDLFLDWKGNDYKQFWGGKIPKNVTKGHIRNIHNLKRSSLAYIFIQSESNDCFIHPNDLEGVSTEDELFDMFYNGGTGYEFKNKSLNEFLNHYCRVFSVKRNYNDPIETMSKIKEVAIKGYYTLMGETLYNHWFSWRIPSEELHNIDKWQEIDNEERYNCIKTKMGVMMA